MSLIWWVIVFVAAIFVLLKSADYFLEAAQQIGLKFKISPFIVGATMVAFGTSLPELVTSMVAQLHNDPEASRIIVGNVIGSNISNVFLICGVALVLSRSFLVSYNARKWEFLIMLVSAIMLFIFLQDSQFTLTEGVVSLIALAGYIAYIIRFNRDDIVDEVDDEGVEHVSTGAAFLVFAISGVLIWLGAKYTVEAIIQIASIVPFVEEENIALTAVALGTSLPELAVTLAAARKNETDVIVGNILGSNVFNTFCVMGVPALFGTIGIVTVQGEPNIILYFSLPLMLLATLMFVGLGFQSVAKKWMGGLFLSLYVAFIVITLLLHERFLSIVGGAI